MKYLIACLMAFGFYGLTYSQSDTSSRFQEDTTGMQGEPTLTCYMVDEETFVCTTEEGTDEDLNNQNEEDLYNDEGVIEEEGRDIEGRDEDVTREPETGGEEFPSKQERESDEGIVPEDQSGDMNDNNQNRSKGGDTSGSQEQMNTY